MIPPIHFACCSLVFPVEGESLKVCFILLTGTVNWREGVKGRKVDRQRKKRLIRGTLTPAQHTELLKQGCLFGDYARPEASSFSY